MAKAQATRFKTVLQKENMQRTQQPQKVHGSSIWHGFMQSHILIYGIAGPSMR